MSNSNTKSSPASGYPTQSLLTGIVKDKTQEYLKKDAVTFASKQGTELINDRLGKVGLSTGMSGAAVNKAVEGARSASEKLSGALGGKLSSVMGAGLGAQFKGGASKQITNLATGAVSKVKSMAQNKLGSALSGSLGASVGGMLGNVVGQLSDSGAKNLTGAKLAAGFLETGPKDESLVEDVYGVSDNNVINSVSEKVSGFARDKFNELRKSPGLITDLTTMLSKGGGGWAVSKESIANRVVGALGGQTGLVRGLSDSLKGSIVNGLGLPENIYDTAVMVIGSGTTRINTDNIDSAREIFSIINHVTRSDEMKVFFDLGSESSLMAGIMREAIALGVPDAIDVLIENAKSDEVAYNALYANMQVAVEHSDLDTVNMMIERLGANTFLSQVPNAAQILLSKYELPVGTTSENYDNEWAALQLALSNLKPDWDKINRGGTMVSDLTVYSTISDDARKLMLRDPTHLVATLIGPTYAVRGDVVDELKRMYPLLPLTAV